MGLGDTRLSEKAVYRLIISPASPASLSLQGLITELSDVTMVIQRIYMSHKKPTAPVWQTSPSIGCHWRPGALQTVAE